MNDIATEISNFSYANRILWLRAHVVFGILSSGFIILYWRTYASLLTIWINTGAYQYAFLIAPICIWLCWMLRHETRALLPRPVFSPVIALMFLGVIWLAGSLVHINLLQHFAVVFVFPVLVVLCYGWKVAGVLWFPLAYLFFAVPWGLGMVGPMQDVTASISVHILRWTGMPVLLEGRQITTPHQVWMVAEACSGVKFFLATTALGCLYAYLMYRSFVRRLIFVVLSLLVPIIANGLRVYFTILIGEKFGIQYATGTDHLVFGWQFFGGVLLLLFLIGWRWREPPVPPERSRLLMHSYVNGTRHFTIGGTALVALAAPALAANILIAKAQAHIDTYHIVSPVLAGEFEGPRPAVEGIGPSFVGADFSMHQRYTRKGAGINLSVFIYAGRQYKGHELLSYENHFYSKKEDTLLSSDTRSVKVESEKYRIRELWIKGDNGGRLIWYWYQVDGHAGVGETGIKLTQILDTVLYRTSILSVSIISTPVNFDAVSLSRRRLESFLHRIALPLKTELSNLRQS